ncbi:MAG TPA: hypothetical protein V6C69_17725 [Trichormus sp.]
MRQEYERSDENRSIDLPDLTQLRGYSQQLQLALAQENKREIEKLCNAIASEVSTFFEIAAPKVRILGVRPLKESGNRIDELYADYDFETARIRLWMRTAVREKATSFGTLLSTLCHEICHHLDVVQMNLPNTFHTRGFYERAGLLYHHIKGTPMRPLVWDKQKNGTFRINWPATMRGSGAEAKPKG